ncbi:MAG: GNAT family N-acetyltransferase [Pseudomonadota bacterium]
MKPFSIDVPTLPAGHVVLRPAQLSDASEIDRAVSEYNVSKMTSSIPHPVIDGATEGFLNSVIEADRKEMVWAIVPADKGTPLYGLISLEKSDQADVEIGYWIAPDHWGKGAASAAVRALVRWNPLECADYFGSCFIDNPASARVMIKAGFIEIGSGSCYSEARKEDVATRKFHCRLRPISV